MTVSASITIPVHNSAPYLDRCLSSAAAQTESGIEIICVNNGSTDESPDILQRFARTDARARVIDEPQPGVSFARNAGVAAASGDYVLFLDSDDAMDPTLVERAVGRARETDADLVFYSFDERYEGTGGAPGATFPWPRAPRDSFYEEPFALADIDVPAPIVFTPNVWRIAFRRSFLAEAGISFPENLRTSEDLVYVYHALFAAKRIAMLPDVLYHYHKDNPASLTRVDRQAAGLVALAQLSDVLNIGIDDSQPRWVQFQFVNLVVDTIRYQLESSAVPEEFATLFEGFRTVWQPYVEANADLVHDVYREWARRLCGSDAFGYLFGLYDDVRRAGEQHRLDRFALEQQAVAARERTDDARRRAADLEREIGEIKSSRSWKLAHGLASAADKVRGVFKK